MEDWEVVMLSGPVVRGRKNPLHYGLPLRLKKAREAAELTVRRLAEKAEVDHVTVLNIEGGGQGAAPKIDTVEKLAHALDLDPCLLAYGIHGEEMFSQKVPGGAGRPGDLPHAGALPAPPTGALSCDGVPDRLCSARGARNLARRALGQKSGTTGQTVANLEAGRNVPSVATVEALAVALKVSPCWLAYGVGQGPEDGEV